MRTKLLIIGVLVGVWFLANQKTEPSPAPAPPGALDLSGAFVGPDAASDAVKVAALAGELADCIEYDAMQPEPVLKTGVALDRLRLLSRQFLCDGESLGEKHPALAKRVGDFLDAELGNSGGPVTPEQTAAWITAYREIERAASRVVD